MPSWRISLLTALHRPRLVFPSARRKRTHYALEQGPSFAPVRRKLAADITKEMLDSGECVGCWLTLCLAPLAPSPRRNLQHRAGFPPHASPVHLHARTPSSVFPAAGEWATTAFKEYNFESAGKEPGGGHLHALMKVRAEFRAILLEMGFSEMPTNRYVERRVPRLTPRRAAADLLFVVVSLQTYPSCTSIPSL